MDFKFIHVKCIKHTTKHITILLNNTKHCETSTNHDVGTQKICK